ncbi:MAG: 7-cyano-7-deazaguanine synthase QueC [Nitratiruptor sp.]|nr:7-cyano-7-deazaguanine synthase QueC [Nitratiruptor sp.]NPA84139.1 7-cyano-7-deazaguanine synthase QueC [Campylobacterota bacterium]
MKRAVAIVSGGMDSSLSALIAKREGYELIGVHFSYGQRTWRRERQAFEAIAQWLGITKRYPIELPFFKEIGASALTDTSIAVPTDGLKPGIPITYVPFRNGIFLSIAAAIAEKEGAEAIVIGVVEEDSSGYPDCRRSFIEAMERAINLGTKDATQITIKTPLIHLKKEQIVAKALELGLPLELTWSCYQREDRACGVCDSCRLRLKGFALAGAKDPIPYLSQ